jgi:type IV secretory pathway TrbF-like protein
MKLNRVFGGAALRGVPADQPAEAQRADASLGRGRREWDDRYAGLARGKRNWQLAALALLAVDGLLTAGIIHLATQSRVSPFVVEVDRLGQAVAFGPAEQLRKTDERLIRYQLNLFIRDVRSVFAQVQWRETHLAPAGRVVSETSWQAVLGVELSPPETTDVLLVNPLGLYVTEINWTKTL